MLTINREKVLSEPKVKGEALDLCKFKGVQEYPLLLTDDRGKGGQNYI